MGNNTIQRFSPHDSARAPTPGVPRSRFALVTITVAAAAAIVIACISAPLSTAYAAPEPPAGPATAPAASASPTSSAPVSAVRSPPPGFEAVSGSPRDEVNAPLLVVIAYAAFFVFMFGYIIFIARKQSDLAKEMAALAERITAAERER